MPDRLFTESDVEICIHSLPSIFGEKLKGVHYFPASKYPAFGVFDGEGYLGFLMLTINDNLTPEYIRFKIDGVTSSTSPYVAGLLQGVLTKTVITKLKFALELKEELNSRF